MSIQLLNDSEALSRASRDRSLLTNSRMACQRACPKRHQFRYELGLVPDQPPSEAAWIGTLFHLACNLDEMGRPDQEIADVVRAKARDAYDAETVLRLWLAHRWRWQDHELDVVATEKAFRMPIRNPETNAMTFVFENGGKVDAVVRLEDGRLALLERKTISDDLSPGSDYWLRVRLDQQISLYVLAVRELGYDVTTILYDVVRRPGMRPGKVPLVDDDGVKIVCDAHGERVRTKDGKKWRESASAADGYVLQTRPETPEEWGARLAEDIESRIDFYFARVEVARTEDDLADFREELWQQQQQLRAAQLKGRWFRNTNACLVPFRCDYLNICDLKLDVGLSILEAGSAPRALQVPPGYKLVDTVHPELADDDVALEAASLADSAPRPATGAAPDANLAQNSSAPASAMAGSQPLNGTPAFEGPPTDYAQL